MRLLSMIALLAFTAAPAPGADKDEDKAKEVAVAFLKAMKAKDLDAVMKTVDVPFRFQGKEGPVNKSEDLKTAFEKLLAKVVPEKIPTEGAKVFDLAALAKRGKEEKKFAEEAEKLVGKSAYVVLVGVETESKRSLPLVVRIKDGQAKVVWIPK